MRKWAPRVRLEFGRARRGFADLVAAPLKPVGGNREDPSSGNLQPYSPAKFHRNPPGGNTQTKQLDRDRSNQGTQVNYEAQSVPRQHQETGARHLTSMARRYLTSGRVRIKEATGSQTKS